MAVTCPVYSTERTSRPTITVSPIFTNKLEWLLVTEETVIEPRRPQLFPSHFEPPFSIRNNWTRCREAVHLSRRSERASPSQTVSLPTISLHRVSSAGRTQRHRTRYLWRSRGCASFTRPQLSFRLCWPLHSTVNTTIQVLRHRAATRVAPFIPNWMHAGVYHPLWPNSSNTAHVGCATRLESWSGTIYLIHRMYNQYLFLTLRSIPHVYRRLTVTVQYLRFLH